MYTSVTTVRLRENLQFKTKTATRNRRNIFTLVTPHYNKAKQHASLAKLIYSQKTCRLRYVSKTQPRVCVRDTEKIHTLITQYLQMKTGTCIRELPRRQMSLQKSLKRGQQLSVTFLFSVQLQCDLLRIQRVSQIVFGFLTSHLNQLQFILNNSKSSRTEGGGKKNESFLQAFFFA